MYFVYGKKLCDHLVAVYWNVIEIPGKIAVSVTCLCLKFFETKFLTARYGGGFSCANELK